MNERERFENWAFPRFDKKSLIRDGESYRCVFANNCWIAWRARADIAAERERELVEALAWYGENARLARLIHSGGDQGRQNIADDGGKRAREVLAKHNKEPK